MDDIVPTVGRPAQSHRPEGFVRDLEGDRGEFYRPLEPRKHAINDYLERVSTRFSALNLGARNIKYRVQHCRHRCKYLFRRNSYRPR
jgi:hypothetical protein